MTPKEKAIDLVDIYKDITTTWIFNGTITTNVINYDLAKNCALIAVSCIITSNPHSNPFNTDVYSTMSYWQDVKKEIEKL